MAMVTWRMAAPWTVLFVLLGGSSGPGAHATEAAGPMNRILGYVNHIPAESTAERELRHRRIAERRAQDCVLLVHRGATAFAPENTLEAYAAAMDYGADGVEIDIRASRDGVLFLFHDDTLERLTNGWGRVRDLTYYQLLAVTPKNVRGTATLDPRPPTLAAFLALARHRAMLLHLDIKEPGLEDQLIARFDEADVWDHIVHINPYNSDRIRRRPGLELYDYKGWLNEAGNLNDPEVVKAFLAHPAKMIFTKEDPTRGVETLGRAAPGKVPLPDGLRAWWTPDGVIEPEPE